MGWASPDREVRRAVTRLHYAPGWVLSVTRSVLLGQPRSFAADAQKLAGDMTPKPRVENGHFIPPDGAFVVVSNHYCKPGYSAWWGPVLIAATIALARPAHAQIVWTMTNRWTYADWLRSHIQTPLTHWFFTRLARMWGWVSMPPMPPQPQYVLEGMRAVRELLSLVASSPGKQPCVGIVPEGRDSPDGSLIQPPAGTGRLLLHLAEHGLPVLPVGVAEVDGVLTARFGPPFQLQVPSTRDRQEVDRLASAQVMTAIGTQLPRQLWGRYRAEIEQTVGHCQRMKNG